MAWAEGGLGGEAPGRHGYGVGVVTWFVSLVISARTSLRGASRVLAMLARCGGGCERVPHWTTGRGWLQRIGLARLSSPKVVADDWAWLVDYSIQVGVEKCLVILGIRLCCLPLRGECLRHEDMELVGQVPMSCCTKETVVEELEKGAGRTGIPRVIVDDHGADVHGGVELFRAKHPQTSEIYDIKHKAACLLKRRLEKDPRWKHFQHRVGQTKFALQQTELAFVAPPSQRSKSRFMNLEPLLAWGERALAVLDRRGGGLVTAEGRGRLEAKLGWLRKYRRRLSEWSEWLSVVRTAVDFVRRQGHYRGAAEDLQRDMPRGLRHRSSARLAEELIEFVAEQSHQARPNERLPGSTEVLESCFGKYKALEKDHAKSGFTGLLLSFGAMLKAPDHDTVRAAFQQTRIKDVAAWCREHLLPTVQSQRRQTLKLTQIPSTKAA